MLKPCCAPPCCASNLLHFSKFFQNLRHQRYPYTRAAIAPTHDPICCVPSSHTGSMFLFAALDRPSVLLHTPLQLAPCSRRNHSCALHCTLLHPLTMPVPHLMGSCLTKGFNEVGCQLVLEPPAAILQTQALQQRRLWQHPACLDCVWKH